MARKPAIATVRATSAGDALTNTPTGRIDEGTCATRSAAAPGVRYLGLPGQQLNPIASTPAATHVPMSTARRTPQILMFTLTAAPKADPRPWSTTLLVFSSPAPIS